MEDDELIFFARNVRDDVLGGRPSTDACMQVCSVLVEALARCGVSAELIVDGDDEDFHAWIRLDDGRVLDPTSDQFDLGLPPIYLGPPLGIHPVSGKPFKLDVSK